MITIKNLQYIVRLAKDLHFNKAANNSFVSQSSLSAGIKNLEEYLGIQLFIRTNKSVIITKEAREIVQQAENILKIIENIESIAKKDFWQKTINIGIIPTISPYLLPKFITQIATNFPQLKINIIEATSAELVNKVKNMKIDMAIFALPYLLPNEIKYHNIYNDNLFQIQHKNYKADKVLLLDEGHCLREHILSQAKINPKNISPVSCSSITTLMAMVNMKIGKSFIPAMAIKNEISQYSNINYKHTKYNRTIGVIYHREYNYQDKVLELIKLIKSSTQ